MHDTPHVIGISGSLRDDSGTRIAVQRALDDGHELDYHQLESARAGESASSRWSPSSAVGV